MAAIVVKGSRGLMVRIGLDYHKPLAPFFYEQGQSIVDIKLVT